MLTAEQKDYIRNHCQDMTAHAIGTALGKHHDTIKRFMKSVGLIPLATKRQTHNKVDFTCTPPLSCFNCPFADCIKGITEVKRTELEDIYDALGGIDTVGCGNGRKRV
ncbi:MAG: hypothetical protein IJZ65_07380 [Ruminiclostridium sp.]|nr:hypothetical protein [Ruminiclostridium sp.]